MLTFLPQFLLSTFILGGGWLHVPCVPCDDEGRVHVTVVAILATDRNDKVDDRLKCIAREVRKEDDKLTGFQLATQSCEAIPLGGKKCFPLVDDLEACVEATQCKEKPDRVCLRVTVPRLGRVKYTSACGKFLPMMTGYETKDKKVLLLAVMVNPCKDEE